jgi:hypothetical protein
MNISVIFQNVRFVTDKLLIKFLWQLPRMINLCSLKFGRCLLTRDFTKQTGCKIASSNFMSIFVSSLANDIVDDTIKKYD